MTRRDVRYVLLHRTDRGWRNTVCEIPLAYACGSLPDTPPGAPFELAAARFEALLREHWQAEGPIRWHQTGPDSWGAGVSGTVPEYEL